MSSAQTQVPSTAASVETSVNGESTHITEDEASLYDRQIRLWGLEAQNRMRSSTVLVLSLRGIAHETIKNLVLAGIGRLIVMDGGVVTEEDLGTGFLFREEDGAVGTERTTAALPQIGSLNPLVSLTAFPTLAPFVRSPSSDLTSADAEVAMVELLQREKVDIVVACDLAWDELEAIDDAARKAGAMVYGAGSYGFYGYVVADLGETYEFVGQGISSQDNQKPGLVKQVIPYASLRQAFDRKTWGGEKGASGSPYRGLTANMTKRQAPGNTIGILAVWEFVKRHGLLPTGLAGQREEMGKIAETIRIDLGVNAKALPAVDSKLLDHLTSHATHFFPPTLAILGGLLAQDVLRALSRKDRPIVNFLPVDTMASQGVTTRFGMEDARAV